MSHSRPHRYEMFDTAIGRCGLAWSPAGVCRVQLPERTETATQERIARLGQPWHDDILPQAIRQAVDAVSAFLAGEPQSFEAVALDLTGVSGFEADVYAALREVRWGQTTTYGALAEAAGHAGLAQAVGNAMGRNPCPLIIPCHRVLAAGNRIGGFSAYGGWLTKTKLLEREGVLLRADRRDQLDLFT
ncbi:methylated-DNA--[protein]-cysteine S-methyltransferase [Consotaella sp. CSK11QG-6]